MHFVLEMNRLLYLFSTYFVFDSPDSVRMMGMADPLLSPWATTLPLPKLPKECRLGGVSSQLSWATDRNAQPTTPPTSCTNPVSTRSLADEVCLSELFSANGECGAQTHHDALATHQGRHRRRWALGTYEVPRRPGRPGQKPKPKTRKKNQDTSTGRLGAASPVGVDDYPLATHLWPQVEDTQNMPLFLPWLRGLVVPLTRPVRRQARKWTDARATNPPGTRGFCEHSLRTIGK